VSSCTNVTLVCVKLFVHTLMKSEIDSISFGVCVFSFVTEVYFFLYRKLWNMGTKQYVYEYKVLDLAEW
jgi:hypothetical protein